MAWSMPNSGPWDPAMMPPDMSMASYSQEQWAVMQQQNWQQWAQWQQQYAQWQTQYGDKYAEQMQAIQALGGMPPLPPANTAPPPAPPPPEQPPPPPHENNKPLYGNTPSQPAPVPPPSSNRNTKSANFNSNTQAGNVSNWSYGPDAAQQQSSTVNSEALKKLAEEERLFDIQFQKWEEEIEKWKKENGNHPDKQAYKEYEEKFEACRAQLLERRKQMNLKRDRLMGAAVPVNTTPTGNKPAAVPSAIPPPLKASSNIPNKQSQNYSQLTSQRSDHGTNQYHRQQYHAPPAQYNRNNNNNVDPQDRFESYDNDDEFSAHTSMDNFSHPDNATFLPKSNSSKGIPGLDLAPDSDNVKNQDVIDITDEVNNRDDQVNAPDYSNISKGINNILGDETIMNILSMVRGQGAEDASKNAPNTIQNRPYGGNNQNNLQFGGNNNRNNSQYGGSNQSNSQFGRNNQTDSQFGGNNQVNPQFGGNNKMNPQFGLNNQTNTQFRGNNLNNPQFGRNNQNGSQFGGDNNQNNPQFGGNNQNNPQFGGDNNQNNPQFGGHNLRNQQYGGNNLPQGQGNRNQNFNTPQNDNRPNLPFNRQGPNNLGQQKQGVDKYPPQTEMFDQRQGEMSQDQYSDRIAPYGAHDIAQSYENGPPPLLGRPNMPAGRPPPKPLMQDIASQPIMNDYSRGPHERRPLQDANINPILNQPPRHKWLEEPLFTPSIIVEYEHKPLRLKAREFIEPVHMFDYNHKSKDSEERKMDYEKEAEQLFSRKPKRPEPDHVVDRFGRDYQRDYERRPPRDDYDDRRRADIREKFDARGHDFRDRSEVRGNDFRDRPDFKDRFDSRGSDYRDRTDVRGSDFRDRTDIRGSDFRDRRDDRDKYTRREDTFSRDRDRGRDLKRDDSRHRSRSHDKEPRKRALSKESDVGLVSKKPKEITKAAPVPERAKHVVMIDDLLESPGREMRPAKIVIILRGLPGSGKSYLAKLIRDKEAEHGSTVRIMSIDDYFMQEGEIEEKDPTTGKMVKKPTLKYEFDEKLEETYMNSLKRAFKRSLGDGYFTFLIYDAVNDELKGYADIWNFARQNGFQVYVCTMDLDPQVCFKRNIHNRTLEDIQVICTRFFPTPSHHIQLDPTTLLQSAGITEVHMEDVDDEVIMEDAMETEVESSFTSKWEKMDDATQLARLDGTNKPLRPSKLSMEDYLQLDDWKPNTAKPGKKTVRWADLEERREQEKMRAIGFVVGQTDWNRMTDPTMGSSALTQTKYIERVRRF